MEATEGVQCEFIAQQAIATGIVELVKDAARPRQAQRLAATAYLGQTNPALDVYLLAGTIHLAVIENVPAELISQRDPAPASSPERS